MNKLLVILLILSVKNVLACSVSVNDVFQKNQLVSLGASELDVSLTSVSSISVESYIRNFEGEDAYYCPLYLLTRAKVKLKYSPKKGHNCDGSVVVHRKQYLGDDPLVLREVVTYSEHLGACSTSITPRPVILPLPRPCVRGVNC